MTVFIRTECKASSSDEEYLVKMREYMRGSGISIAYGHARSTIASMTAMSPLGSFLIPAIDPTALLRKMEDEEEKMVFCIVDPSVLDECMDLVKRNKMLKWKDGRGLNGKRYVVRFMSSGELIRVTSDDMPDNGLEAFYEIENVLSTAWSQNYSSLDTETWFCPNCGTKNNRRYCMECGVEKPE